MSRQLYPDLPVTIRLVQDNGSPWGDGQTVPNRSRQRMTWKNDGDQVIIIGWQGELTILGLAEIGLNPHRTVRTPMGPVTLPSGHTITLMFRHAGHVKVT